MKQPRAITRHFDWRPDPEFNVPPGWLMRGMPHFDPTRDTLAVYHDTFEHLDMGRELSDEAQAFGAMMFFREDVGFHEFAEDKRRPAPNAKDYAADLESFIEDAMHTGNTQPSTLFALNGSRMSRPGDPFVEDRLDAVHHQLILDLAKMAQWQADAYVVPPADRVALADRVRHWMRLGYRRAERRWGSTGHAHSAAYTACDLIMRATQYVTKKFGEDGYVGMSMSVRYWPDSPRAHVILRHDGRSIPQDICY